MWPDVPLGQELLISQKLQWKTSEHYFTLPTFSNRNALGTASREAEHLGKDTSSACSNWELLFIEA